MPVWGLAQFADIDLILKTIANKLMAQLAIMNKELQPLPPTSEILEENREVPDLEMITRLFKEKHPTEPLPDAPTYAKNGEVFSNLADAHRPYGKAAQAIAELSTKLSPQHYSMLLTASVMPTVQIVVPGTLVSPVMSPHPPQAAAKTALGRSEIIKFTKEQVLPNPQSPALTVSDKNSPTQVLAAAIYIKIEQLFFDETTSRLDVATAFRCNACQLQKAVTGVHYKGGPHTYKLRPRTATK